MGDEPGYCDDCGQPAVGSYQFFYANEREGKPTWSPTRPVCLKHKKIREQLGHKSRIPTETDGENAPDPVPSVGTQAPDYDANLAAQAAAAAPPAPARPKVVVEPLE